MATRVFRTYKAILDQAHRAGHIAHNPANGIRATKRSSRKPKVSIPSKAQLRSLLEAGGLTDDAFGRTAIEALVFSGLRASELRGLSWDDVSLEKRTLTVSRRADARNIIGLPKSHSSHRVIPIPDRLVGVLKEWKLACPPHERRLVFPSETGKIISYGVLRGKHMDPLQVLAGVATSTGRAAFGLHPFRHAAASLWIEQGLDPYRIKTLMGHSSIQVTFDTYGHLFEDAKRDRASANAIANALFGSNKT